MFVIAGYSLLYFIVIFINRTFLDWLMGSRMYSNRLMRRKHKPRYGRGRAKRPKTFKTEEKAKEYAKKLGLKKFEVEKMLKGKYRVITENA